ncbi:MAG: homocysteine S-methyltransferase family protein [Lachnospiraceae bacterium]
MTREEFAALCRENIVLLDGATGTNLQAAGMPTGVCPEQWILEHPQVIKNLQKEFLHAGTVILYAPTFSGNRIKLKEYGLENRLAKMNAELVALSKEAVREFEASRKETGKPADPNCQGDRSGENRGCGGRRYVAGDLTMTGQLLYPMGTLRFEELIDIYKEQVRALVAAGADLLVVETMMSLQECRAAVLAVREECDLPLMVTLTFAGDEKTMYGTTPETAMVVLQSLGADAVGVNCSAGPETLAKVVSRMYAVANVPVIAKPNAGLPKLSDGETVYEMAPEAFAAAMTELIQAGAGVVGGCCGSTPSHIAALHDRVEGLCPPEIKKEKKAMLTTERESFPVEPDGAFQIIGERINPTGKKALQAELKEGSMDMVIRFAKEQEEAGAYLLDVNAGMSGIDEKETMLRMIEEVTQNSSLPLCLDSSYVEVLEAALRAYPGRALVNSVSAESEKMKRLLPVVKKYGAMFLLLPLSEEGLPKDEEEKRKLIHTVMEEAFRLGFTKEDIIVDGLVNTIGAGKEAAKNTLATIRYCREELGVATSIGLSNISFGLPARGYVNSAFLAMAIEAGLTMAIANPCNALTKSMMLAADLLTGKDGADLRFIEHAPAMTEQLKAGGASASTLSAPTAVTEGASATVSAMQTALAGAPDTGSALFTAVLKGNKRKIVELTEQVLDTGKQAQEILNLDLIPAINEVGTLFEQQKYFLPQLIASAETMELAVKRLEPLLLTGASKKQGTVVIATVKGDIHDIGKNLVALMLKNYGFEVIDLGKDVDSETIVQTAKEQDADLIALSALMTTTMTRMKEVVALRNAAGIRAKVIIGGAVTTEQYAEEIGADGYSKDAQEAVKVALSLVTADKNSKTGGKERE